MPLQLTEARARAALVRNVTLDLEFDLTRSENFGCRATLRFDSTRPGTETFLELSDATELSATLNGDAVMPYDGERLALPNLVEHNVVELTARLPYVSDGDGMHAITDPADGERYVAAYTAMDIARRVVPCFDQPDLKTRFTLSVLAPAHWTVLANGPETSREETPHGVRFVFGQTPPISTYLFFVCGGPFVGFTWTEEYAGRELPFGWYARASLADVLERDADELRDITSRCFRWYTEAFDEPYAFADYQQVFTPGLNWGAMEFPGCVAFRDEYLYRGEPTAIQRNGRASVIAHEMAHMWFGDLVTMRWWEDSWLNESFADFMGYEVAGRAAGFDQSWVTAAVVRKPTAYQADRRRSTHPVAEDAEKMPDADTAFANFDMITYAKGNALVRQLAIWLGEDDFLRGVNGYLSSHPFGNASLADFLDALAAASERDVRGWAEAFLRTTGYDTLRLTRDGDVPVLTREGSRPHRLSITTYDEQMHVVGSQLVDLGDEPLRLPEAAGLAVVPNSGDETYARVVLDDLTWARVREQMSAVEDPVTRALLWWTAVDGCEGGEVSLVELVELAARHLPNEEHPVVFEGALRLVQRTIVRQSSPEVAQEAMAALAGLAETVLRRDDVRRAAASRVLASCSTDGDQLRAWLDHADLPAPDQDVRWLVVRRLAALGDDTHLANERSADRSVSGELGARAASAATPTAEAKAAAWASLVSGDLSNREFEAVAAGFWQWDQTDLVRPYLDRHAPDLLELGARSGQAMGDIIGAAFPWLPLTPHDRSVVRSGLEQALAGDVPTVLRRTWDDLLDDLDRVIQGSPTESLR